MRAFLAVPVAPPAYDAGLRLLDRLKAALPDVRWVRGEGLHLTLHFFASIDEDETSAVVRAAGAVVSGLTPYTATVGGLGCFPRDGDERVLWIGMREGQAETAALQRAVDDALRAQGFPGEARGFKPHVTLGRPRRRFDEAARTRWRRFADESLPAFAVEEVRLYRSHPGPGGSVYEVLARLPLSGPR